MCRIGVISDTHNYLDPKVAKLFAGVTHILHAGDIGQPWLISELETIAPVTAVSGNTDDPGFHYRETQIITLAGLKILIHHIINPHTWTGAGRQPAFSTDVVRERILHEKPDLVVFGHTHKPFSSRSDGILFFNPGYAGKSRFGMERTVAILHCTDSNVEPEYLPL